jgi:DNA-binding NarL/FixJ family response regulator
VARVFLLTADLLFGSQVQGALTAAGHEVRSLGSGSALARDLSERDTPAPELLVVDLTDESLDGAGVVESLAHELRQIGTLGFYSHVDVSARERAEAAGVELVVPRSRMAREGAQLVAGLLAGSA